MNKDVRIGTNYPMHIKTRKLKNALGAEGVMSHIFLLCFVALTTPSGMLKDMSPEDIAWAARWRGDPDHFVNTLVEVGFLDKRGDTYGVHNWPKHNYFAMTAPIRSEIARRNINKRWAKKSKLKQANNTGRSNDANTNSKTSSNTPSPSPSLEMDDGVEGDLETSTPEATSSQSPYEELERAPPSEEMVLKVANTVAAKHKYPEITNEVEEYLNNGMQTSDLYFLLMELMHFEPKGLMTPKFYFRQQLKERGSILQKGR